MKKRINYFLIAGTLLLSACSTDLEVIGNYKETMVVYGLLDQSQSKQYIKINKAFLGEGNAFAYAQIKDSVQFVNSLSVVLKRITNGVVTSTYNLSPDNSIPKNPGTFYGQDQTNAIYSFTSTGGNALNTDSKYKLIIKNNETGTEVTSETSLIRDAIITKPMANNISFPFITPNNTNFFVKWTTGLNAKIYQLIIRFNYIDYFDSTTTGSVSRHIDWFFPERTVAKIDVVEEMTEEFRGQDFLNFVGSSIIDNPSVLKRIPGNIDFLLISAGDELNTYIEVNKPSTGIIQEKPQFTNITNGLGVFSSRFNKAPFSRPLSSLSLDELSSGQFTKCLRFLDSNGDWTDPGGCN